MIDDKIWRLNNLYRIVDKNGDSIPFKLNSVQEIVARDSHNRKLILKARQLGMSTFAVIDLLDDVLFNNNRAAGIVSYSLEHATHIYKRIIGHALETFPSKLKPLVGILSQSAREITFTNGSFLRVDTSLRGGSYQSILVSEFGKTCARSPLKAEEVITGTLQALPSNGRVVIESTGEGTEGYFAEMCLKAHEHGNNNLSPLDYKMFFFPWYTEKKYIMDHEVSYDTDMTDYFFKVEKESQISLSREQKFWYAQKHKELADKVKQEFPSTINEAFLSNSDAYYYAEYIAKAHEENRILSISPYDPLVSVNVAMDIGVNDLTVMIFFQIIHGEIRIIDYYEDNRKGVDFYVKYLTQDRKYLLGTIFLPHDSVKMDGIVIENSYERDFRRLLSGTAIKVQVLKRSDRNLGISHVKTKFSRMVFNGNKCKKLLDHVGKYRKKWSESQGRYLDEPLHDIHSNHADALRYVCHGVNHLEALGNIDGAQEKHRMAVNARNRMI